MAFWDRFRRKRTKKRNFTASHTGRLFNDWNTMNSSPDGELENNLKLMRDRARDLARNNGIITRYLQLMKEGVVGNQGFRLKVKGRDADGSLDDFANDLIEYKWYQFSESPEVSETYTMNDLYEAIVVGILRDGEVLVQKIKTREGLKLKFIEPDFLDSRLNKDISDTRQIRMGVEIDRRTLKPLGYWLKNNPYQDALPDQQLQRSQRINAEDMMHIYQPERFGQTRGYPKIASVMTSIKWLNDYRLSELVASKVGASKMGFITSPSGDGYAESYGGNEYLPQMNFEPGTFDQLPDGYDIKFFDPQHPTSQMPDYDKAMLRTIASGLGVSYASLSGDLTQTSFSSARVGLISERDSFKQMQSFIVHHFAIPLYREWLLQAITVGDVTLPITKYDKFASPTFTSRAYESVDPLKQAQANILNVNQGLATMQDVLAQQGKDVAEHFSEIDSEKALSSKFDIEFALEPFGNKFNPMTGELFDTENLNEDNDNAD